MLVILERKELVEVRNCVYSLLEISIDTLIFQRLERNKRIYNKYQKFHFEVRKLLNKIDNWLIEQVVDIYRVIFNKKEISLLTNIVGLQKLDAGYSYTNNEVTYEIHRSAINNKLVIDSCENEQVTQVLFDNLIEVLEHLYQKDKEVFKQFILELISL